MKRPVFYVLWEFSFVKNWVASNKLQSPAVPWHCLWNVEKKFGAACGVFPPWSACLLTPTLEGINQSDKDSSNTSTPPSPSWDTQGNCLHVILKNIFFFFWGFPSKSSFTFLISCGIWTSQLVEMVQKDISLSFVSIITCFLPPSVEEHAALGCQ